MSDFKLDLLTNDLDIVNGDILLTANTGELAAQKVSINLKTFKGEWVYNVLAGIPYLERDGQPIKLLGGKSKFFLDQAIKEGILSRDGVIRLESYESVLDKVTGVVSIEFTAITEEGEITQSVALTI